MSRPYQAPETRPSMPISIPFPTDGFPVEITESSLSFEWHDVNYSGAMDCDYKSSYTIRYTGDTPGKAEIAIPLLNEPGIQRQRPAISIDGMPADCELRFSFQYIDYENIHEQEEWNAFDFNVFINDVRSQDTPYMPVNFDPDSPASCYTLMQEGPFSTSIGFELILSYEPSVTTLLIDAPFDFEPDINYFTYDHSFYTYKIHKILFSRPEPFDVLAIGEDTLQCHLQLQNKPEDLEDSTLNVSAPIAVTPREFINRAAGKSKALRDPFIFPISFDKFLLRWVDNYIYIQQNLPFDAPKNFVNILCFIHVNPYQKNDCLFRYESKYRDFRPQSIYSQQAVIATIPFEPMQERILNISHTLVSGKIWYEKNKKSLLYCPILTQSAGYWDFFGPCRITTTHPSGKYEKALTEGFALDGKQYILLLDSTPDKNIFVGFRVPDERRAESSFDAEMFFLLLFLFASHFWPITLLIITGICILVYVMIKRMQKRK